MYKVVASLLFTPFSGFSLKLLDFTLNITVVLSISNIRRKTNSHAITSSVPTVGEYVTKVPFNHFAAGALISP